MSPLYEDPCPYCGINYDLVYLCLDCHEVFCADCVNSRTEESYVCLNCGGTEINTDKQGQLFCSLCHAQEIQTLNKTHPFCPNCQGGNVVKITEKQTQLLDDFKSIVYGTRQFLGPLDQFLTTLNEKRHLLLRLREDDPKCYHFPNLEAEFLVLFKLFDAAKKNVYEQVTGYFNEIQRHLNYIIEIPKTFPNNLPFIDGIIKNLQREENKITQNAQDVLIPLNKRYEEIMIKLHSVEEIHSLFLSFIQKLQLETDEKIVFGIKCKLAEGSSQGTDISSKNGTILITSKRLHFFQEQGVFKKKMVLLFSVKLDDLQQIGVKGRLKKTVSLDFVNSMYNFSLTKDKREELIEWIEKARVFDARNTLDNTNLEKLEKYKLDIKIFKEELENAIYELIGFKGIQLQQNSHSKSNLVDRTLNSPMHPRNPPVNSGKSTISRPNPIINNNYPHVERNEWDYPTRAERVSDHGRMAQNPRYPNYPLNPSYPPFNPQENLNPNSYKVPQPDSNRYYPFDEDHYQRPKSFDGGDIYNQNEERPTQIFRPAPEYDPYQSRKRHPFSNNGFDSDSDHHFQLNNLKQEEFGLIQTVKMLEQRFDGGMMNNIEFVKNYRTLQKELYVIQEKIRQMQHFAA